MERLLVCRICLVDNVRMHEIKDKNLQDTYEKITNVPFDSDLRPVLACYICYTRLKNCYQFIIKCLQAEELLTQIINEDYKKPQHIQGVEPTYYLKISSVEILSITEIDEDSIKEEPESTEIHLKEEKCEDSQSDILDPDLGESQTDSEDDKPLTEIKIEGEQKIKKKKLDIKRGVKKYVKLDASEIILSKEQQMDTLVARSKSMNYNNSPYKCDICYKGFVDLRAFDNHKLKHDERSGSYSCDICQMRYRSTQQLRTHTVTAHERIYKCNKCGYVTHTANQARVHEKWHYGHTYQCQLCSHVFRKPTSYLSHMRKRHPTEHVCDVCGDSFVGKHGLQMHKSKTHKIENKVEQNEEPASERFCVDCNIQFSSINAWKRHILSSVKHTLKNEHSKQCGICGLMVGTSTALHTHMKGHAKSLKIKRNITVETNIRCQCTQCGSNFVNKSKLTAHINRTHLGLKYNKNIVCEVCGKKCTSNATLKYHQRTHTGEKPYTCNTCSKQFSDSNQLRIHTRTHTGEKPYICTSCGKRFTQKPALNRHYRVHTGAKPYTCQYCSRTFSQSNSLKLHVKAVHLKQHHNKKKSQDTNMKMDELQNGQTI